MFEEIFFLHVLHANWYIFVLITDLFNQYLQHRLPVIFSLRGGVWSPSNPFELYRAHLLLDHSHLVHFSHLCSWSAADRLANHTHGRDGQHITFGLLSLHKASAHSKQWQKHQLNSPHRRSARLCSCWMSKANWVMVHELILRPQVTTTDLQFKLPKTSSMNLDNNVCKTYFTCCSMAKLSYTNTYTSDTCTMYQLSKSLTDSGFIFVL